MRTCHCPECEARRELVGFQRWGRVSAYDNKWLPWAEWQAASYRPEKLAITERRVPSQALIDENLSTLPHSHLFAQNAIRCALVPIRAHLEDYEPPVN
ncbi:MAG: hypothetical protein QOJ51_5310 [Acidobacteriaceae bacterium]|jgi:hypothetical protein|nr:hypothetical protein [Acidobacteriaceae bacterium]MEA2262485.1 hypothetical protein [Acidobacteriaceae bacterium]